MIDVLENEVAQDEKLVWDKLQDASLTQDKKERLKEVSRLLLSMAWPICKIHRIRIRTDTHQIYPIYDCFSLKLHVDGDCVEVQIGTFTN